MSRANGNAAHSIYVHVRSCRHIVNGTVDQMANGIVYEIVALPVYCAAQ